MKSIIISIVMFLFLILIHEFGHFIIAKKSGIRVNEFAVGMGPKIYSKKRGETLYSINLLPIGGYCAMEGEDEESDDERSFDKVSAHKRFFTVLAGPVTNLLFAAIIFAIVIFNTGIASTKIGGFTKNSPARQANLEISDKILEIDGKEVKEFSDISKILNNHYKDKEIYEKIPVKVLRNGESIERKVGVRLENNAFYLGITPSKKSVGLLEAIRLGVREVFQMIGMLFSILKNLFTGKLSFSALSGPVGVVKELGRQADLGIMNLLFFLAYISVNLGFFNLLPIPALDGSKLFTCLYEMISKRKVNKKLEEKFTMVGFILLLTLIVVVTIKDLINLF